MKTLLVVCISVLIIAAVPENAAERSFSTEALQWGGSSVLLVSAWYMDRQDPWFNHPLIGGETDKAYHSKDRVPYTYVLAGGLGVFASVVFMPNEQGFFSDITYDNAKGFFGACGTTFFITSFSKSFFGRKRPSYDNYPESSKNRDGRKSFISGHSSASFMIATYGSLYLFNHFGGDSQSAGVTAIKFSAAALLYFGAGYTAWSRVADNKHNVSDVAAGGAVGVITSFLFYQLYNKEKVEKDVSVEPYYDGIHGGLACSVTF